jgi:hypothetical protein
LRTPGVDAFLCFFCAFFPAVKKTAKTVSLQQIQNFKKYEKASTLCVGEINFGSFELLSTKNGLVVEVGSGMGTFFPVLCPQPVDCSVADMTTLR